MPRNFHRGVIMQAVARMFSNHAYESELGSRVATEAGFKLLISNTAFASDFGFIAQERLPKDCNCTGSGEVMPDFSVEWNVQAILSPNRSRKVIYGGWPA